MGGGVQQKQRGMQSIKWNLIQNFVFISFILLHLSYSFFLEGISVCVGICALIRKYYFKEKKYTHLLFPLNFKVARVMANFVHK